MAKLTGWTHICLQVHEFVAQYINFRLLSQTFTDADDVNIARARLISVLTTSIPDNLWLVDNARTLSIQAETYPWIVPEMLPHLRVIAVPPQEKMLEMLEYRLYIHDVMADVKKSRSLTVGLLQLLEWGLAAITSHMRCNVDSRTTDLIGLITEMIVFYPIRENLTYYEWMKKNGFWNCDSPVLWDIKGVNQTKTYTISGQMRQLYNLSQ